MHLMGRYGFLIPMSSVSVLGHLKEEGGFNLIKTQINESRSSPEFYRQS
jgi:hypothetical protein